VIVLARLGHPVAARLRAVLPLGTTLLMPDVDADFMSTLRLRDVNIVVIDPAAEPCPGVSAAGPVTAESCCVAALVAAPDVPVVLYSRVSETLLRAMLVLRAHRSLQLIVRDVDDDAATLRATVLLAEAADREHRALAVLSPILDRVDPRLGRAVRGALFEPTRYRRVAQLARAAGVSARTLARQFGDAGLAEPRRFLACGHVLEAYRALQDASVSVDTAAARAGYHSSARLRLDVRRLTGRTPSDLRNVASIEAVAELLVGKLRRRTGARMTSEM
jgi:AraC-like DNA-binding protein